MLGRYKKLSGESLAMIPAVGEVYLHAKSGRRYIIYCISKSGDRESNQLFVTYRAEEDKEATQLFTRTLEDFFALVYAGVRRFIQIK